MVGMKWVGKVRGMRPKGGLRLNSWKYEQD
jgi:hypothetical protein